MAKVQGKLRIADLEDTDPRFVLAKRVSQQLCCARKIRYASKEESDSAKFDDCESYQCSVCGQWHNGHQRGSIYIRTGWTEADYNKIRQRRRTLKVATRDLRDASMGMGIPVSEYHDIPYR